MRKYLKVHKIGQTYACNNLWTSRTAQWPIHIKFLSDLCSDHSIFGKLGHLESLKYLIFTMISVCQGWTCPSSKFSCEHLKSIFWEWNWQLIIESLDMWFRLGNLHSMTEESYRSCPLVVQFVWNMANFCCFSRSLMLRKTWSLSKTLVDWYRGCKENTRKYNSILQKHEVDGPLTRNSFTNDKMLYYQHNSIHFFRANCFATKK